MAREVRTRGSAKAPVLSVPAMEHICISPLLFVLNTWLLSPIPIDLQGSPPLLKNDRNYPLPGAGTVRQEASDLQRMQQRSGCGSRKPRGGPPPPRNPFQDGLCEQPRSILASRKTIITHPFLFRFDLGCSTYTLKFHESWN